MAMAPRHLFSQPMWRTTTTRSRAQSESGLPAPMRAPCRCDCAPARAPVALPGLALALRTGWHSWHWPGPMARVRRSWQGKSVLQRLS
eukprot:scaffold2376_cov115-Isochrysis_galbana.AAC.10